MCPSVNPCYLECLIIGSESPIYFDSFFVNLTVQLHFHFLNITNKILIYNCLKYLCLPNYYLIEMRLALSIFSLVCY